VKTAVINKRAGGMGLISGRKAFQRPMAEGRPPAQRRAGRLPQQGDHDRLRDRRVRARVAVHGDVLGKIHATSPAPVVNLSETGALVEVDCVLRPGHRADAALPLRGAGDLILRCRVVRSFIHGFDRAAGEESAGALPGGPEFVGSPTRSAPPARPGRRASRGDRADAELAG
jgi:hypothetical protein